ncbi:hypothetical protein [Rhizobium sp. NZLR4b]|uniref:hypothetical protein n=1 Tax=Rhizobium sp. NZLR4b TaxID=2731102 RepID=UPI001C82D432|nr:hypothetical protein [Rhizobium sp. NZLR4b]MBX5164834.1 hypothetical protein [Rhizobium sp. NZLR4b]
MTEDELRNMPSRRLMPYSTKAFMPAIRIMGRDEITNAHAAGLPGVYMVGNEIVYEYPGGEIVGLAEHRRRNAEAIAAQIKLQGLESMTEDEIDELADRLVEEARRGPS